MHVPTNTLKNPWLALFLLTVLALSERVGVCQAAAAPLLAVVNDAQVIATAPSYAQADAGLVDPAATPEVTQVFRLKNATPQPVTISRLRASCGCETLLLSKGGKSVSETLLAPGEQVEVKMTVKLTGERTGVLNKFAWVYGPQGDPPLATLAMAITIREVVSFSPSFLDFGAVAVSSTHSQPLTVTVDQSEVPATGLPPLVSARPDLRITAQGSPQPVTRDGKPSVRQDYLVTLMSPLQSGRLSGDIRFQTLPLAASLLARAFVPLGGTVTGELAASPKTLFFGSVSSSQPITRQVLIAIPAKDASGTFTASSDIPWLQAALQAPSAGLPQRRLLEVTLKPGSPSGSMQAQITVISPTGERLLIPVIAEVIPQASPK